MKMIQTSATKRKYKRLVSFFLVITVLVLCGQVSFAQNWDEALAGYPDAVKYLKQFVQGFVSIFDAFKKIASSICAVALCWIGLTMIGGDKKEQEAGLQKIKWILFAFCVLQIVPLLISFGKSLFSGLAWDPTNPNSLVQNLFPDASPTPTP